MMTEQWLADLRATADCIKDWPLPWVYDEVGGTIHDAGRTLHYEGQDWVSAGRLTVAAVNALPDLLAALDTARQERDEALERLAEGALREAALRSALRCSHTALDRCTDVLFDFDVDTVYRDAGLIADEAMDHARAALAATEPGQEGAET